MKIYPDKLQGQLARELLSLYIVSGDEPLLVQESSDLIRDELIWEMFRKAFLISLQVLRTLSRAS